METTKHPGVYQKWEEKRQNLYTIKRGETNFEEETFVENEKVFRLWDPTRSKLGSAIKNKLKFLPIRKGKSVLYLGAANGYTPSFVSDIVEEGSVFCLDVAPLPLRDLFFLAQKRENMVAMLEDAKTPEEYKEKIPTVDVVYQDIAQRDQTKIFIKNMEACLKKGGYGLMAVKSRSIDVTKRPRDVYQEQRTILYEAGYEVVEMVNLEPFERDHVMVLVRKKH